MRENANRRSSNFHSVLLADTEKIVALDDHGPLYTKDIGMPGSESNMHCTCVDAAQGGYDIVVLVKI